MPQRARVHPARAREPPHPSSHSHGRHARPSATPPACRFHSDSRVTARARFALTAGFGASCRHTSTRTDAGHGRAPSWTRSLANFTSRITRRPPCCSCRGRAGRRRDLGRRSWRLKSVWRRGGARRRACCCPGCDSCSRRRLSFLSAGWRERRDGGYAQQAPSTWSLHYPRTYTTPGGVCACVCVRTHEDQSHEEGARCFRHTHRPGTAQLPAYLHYSWWCVCMRVRTHA